MANNTIPMTGSATPAAVGTVALPGTAGAFGGSAAGAFGASPDWATAASASGARVAMTLAPGWVRVTARLAGVAGARAVARAAGVAVPPGVAGAPGNALGAGAGSIVARGAAGAPLAVESGWAVTLSTARVAGATGAGDDCPVGVAARVLVGAGIGLGVGVEPSDCTLLIWVGVGVACVATGLGVAPAPPAGIGVAVGGTVVASPALPSTLIVPVRRVTGSAVPLRSDSSTAVISMEVLRPAVLPRAWAMRIGPLPLTGAVGLTWVAAH